MSYISVLQSNLCEGKELDNRTPPPTHTHTNTTQHNKISVYITDLTHQPNTISVFIRHTQTQRNTTQQNFCIYNRPHTQPNTISVLITHHTYIHTYTHTKHDTTTLSVYMTSRNFILMYIFMNFGSQCEWNFFLDLASKILACLMVCVIQHNI